MSGIFINLGSVQRYGGRSSSLSRALTSALSVFAGAAAAYSVRIPSGSTYTGPVVRVKRSSDNAEIDIGAVAMADVNGDRWMDEIALLDHVGLGGGFVTTWYDQSGNGRNAVQATAANQPRIVNAGVIDVDQGRPTLIFNGTTKWLNTPININRTNYPNLTVSTVYRNTALSGNQALWGADNGSWDRFQLMKFNSAPSLEFGLSKGTGAEIYPLLNNINRNVYTSVMSLGTANGTNVFVNGVAGTSFTEALGDGHSTLTIGAINQGGAYGVDGNFSEFAVFPSALSTARQALERNQGIAFGITVA